VKVSIVIPALNEADRIANILEQLKPAIIAGHQVIVVDGGSEDNTAEIASGPGVQVVVSDRTDRAYQMNLGIRETDGDAVLFLHADTQLPKGAIELITRCLELDYFWGRFDVRLSGRAFMFRIIERMMNLRSCLTGIATGDQAMFISREGLDIAGDFPDIPVMEDVAMSKLLKLLLGRPACIHHPVITSSRRWEQKGITRTVLLMWWLRLIYFLGVSPATIARRYWYV